MMKVTGCISISLTCAMASCITEPADRSLLSMAIEWAWRWAEVTYLPRLPRGRSDWENLIITPPTTGPPKGPFWRSARTMFASASLSLATEQSDGPCLGSGGLEYLGVLRVGGPKFHPPDDMSPPGYLPPSGSRGVTITNAYIWAPEKPGLAPFCPINHLEAEFSFFYHPTGRAR